ncbi:MAG: hypothetical protein LQ338_003469 [Usnochroma carphineum]|nr:MAG: hypothetical protein LQ338_003469 [Usnochroma carphineum]
MASSHASLDAAATERKARLAKLKSLKRKQPVDESTESTTSSAGIAANSDQPSPPPSVTTAYLSGRNYDPTSRGPKLGFESAPTENAETLEDRAEQIAQETTAQEAKEEKEDKPIDLFKLQPKKPNWDLKRDLARKMEILNVRTDNAIARLVRERIEGAKKKSSQQPGQEDGEKMGLRGEELVEGVHQREREEQEDERREREYAEGIE